MRMKCIIKESSSNEAEFKTGSVKFFFVDCFGRVITKSWQGLPINQVFRDLFDVQNVVLAIF